MINLDNVLTDELKSNLKQGTKVEFKWYGNSELVYTGRIGVDKFGRLYFVNEFNYENDVLIQEGMRWYNPLDSFSIFNEFKILE